MTKGFGHLTLTLLLHYLVKCRSRSFTVYNSKFILAGTCIGSNQGSKSMGRTIATSFWETCCFLTFAQHLEASFSFFSRTVSHHIMPKISSTSGSRDAWFYRTCSLAA